MSDLENMQNILNDIVKWQECNNMVFNTKKFKLLQVGKNTELKTQYYYEIE